MRAIFLSLCALPSEPSRSLHCYSMLVTRPSDWRYDKEGGEMRWRSRSPREDCF